MKVRFRARVRAMRLAGTESGSALVLALLVVAVVSVLLGAALDSTRTGLNLAPKIRNDRNVSNYVQGAVEGAIESIRGSSLSGLPGQDCPDFVPSVPTDLAGADTHTYKVTCSAQGASTGAGVDQPFFAIHTLGTGNSLGIRQTAGNHLLRVRGGIFSNGVVTVADLPDAQLDVLGSAQAISGCEGILTVSDSGGPDCDYERPVGSTWGLDPNLAPSIDRTDDGAAGDLDDLMGLISQEDADPVPTCSTRRGLVSFTPGYYGSNPTELRDSISVQDGDPDERCEGSTFHFAPGRYYFDYTTRWGFSDLQVIAGQLNPDWDSGDPLDTACLSDDPDDLTDGPYSGAQFVFGGNSRLWSDPGGGGGGGIVVCGPQPTHSWPGNPQRIALYGLAETTSAHTASSTSTPVSGTVDWEPAVAPISFPANEFNQPARARSIDLESDTANLNRREDVTLAYSDSPTVPEGSRVTNARVRVSQVLVNSSATLTLEGANGVLLQQAMGATTCTVFCEFTIPLGNVAPWRDLNQLQITYSARGPEANGQTGTATVNGIRVLANYTEPALRPLTCTSGCAFFESRTNPNVFFKGTVYTPSAAWAVNVHNAGTTVFDRGIVALDLDINVGASSKQLDEPFQLPRGAPSDRVVLFKGFLDGATQESVRACVVFDDKPFAGYRLSVPHWTVLRTPGSASPDCT